MSNTKPNRLDAQLLIELQRFFARRPATHYPTEQLLNYLAGIHTAPWATFDQGKPITARHLARLLQPYGIAPKNIRVSATATPKGYKVADFDTVFAQLNDLTPHAMTVADNVAAIPDDVADNVAANVADNPSGIADNILDATRNQLYRLGASLTRGYEATGNPFSHASSSEIQHWRDLAKLLRQAAESIDSFTATTRPALTLIQGGTRTVADNVADKVADKVKNNVAAKNVADNVAATVADNPDGIAAKVVTMTRAAVTTTDNLPAPVQAKPARKWPPPKGWAWNHETGDYEPPKPTVQSEPMDQETIRQTLHVDLSLQYLPGKGLVAV